MVLNGSPVSQHRGKRSLVLLETCRERRERIDLTKMTQSDKSRLEILRCSPLMVIHRDLIVALAGRHRLPAVYTASFFATGGGLISYGPGRVDQYRRAAA